MIDTNINLSWKVGLIIYLRSQHLIRQRVKLLVINLMWSSSYCEPRYQSYPIHTACREGMKPSFDMQRPAMS